MIIVKNGSIHTGKPKYACKDCSRQFVENPQNRNQPIPPETTELIDKLLLEKIALETIARVTGWLQKYVDKKYEQIPREAKKSKGRLTLEIDEAWSFVLHKKNKQWIWLALDRETREVVGVYIGARDAEAAQKLWQSLPPVYRQCAVSYTDFWKAYQIVLPSKRHHAVGKETGLKTTLSVLMAFCVNGFLGCSEKLYLFLKKSKTILVVFGISFIIITSHYAWIIDFISLPMQDYPNFYVFATLSKRATCQLMAL